MKRKWIFTIINYLSIIAGIVSCGIIFVYWYTFGSISNDKDCWATFGSVISGAFTLMSSSATIATLLFLYKQQDENNTHQKEQQNKHDKVVEKQMAALTFEQYLNHRKIFFERFQEQAFLFGNKITFKNSERTYSNIFTENSPTHCSYKVDIIQSKKNNPRDINDCISIFNGIKETLNDYNDTKSVFKLIDQISRLQNLLGYEYSGEILSGDIYYLERHTGINIYEVNTSIYRLESVLNSILFYTGNEPIPSIKHEAEHYFLRDGLYETLNNYLIDKGIYSIIFKSDEIKKLFDLYFILKKSNIMEDSFRRLELIFSNKNEICKLENKSKMKETTASIWIDYIKSSTSSDNEVILLREKISLILTTFSY